MHESVWAEDEHPGNADQESPSGRGEGTHVLRSLSGNTGEQRTGDGGTRTVVIADIDQTIARQSGLYWMGKWVEEGAGKRLGKLVSEGRKLIERTKGVHDRHDGTAGDTEACEMDGNSGPHGSGRNYGNHDVAEILASMDDGKRDFEYVMGRISYPRVPRTLLGALTALVTRIPGMGRDMGLYPGAANAIMDMNPDAIYLITISPQEAAEYIAGELDNEMKNNYITRIHAIGNMHGRRVKITSSNKAWLIYGIIFHEIMKLMENAGTGGDREQEGKMPRKTLRIVLMGNSRHDLEAWYMLDEAAGDGKTNIGGAEYVIRKEGCDSNHASGGGSCSRYVIRPSGDGQEGEIVLEIYAIAVNPKSRWWDKMGNGRGKPHGILGYRPWGGPLKPVYHLAYYPLTILGKSPYE